MQIGFDNELYMRRQKEEIKKRVEKFGNKLYLEFGGKMFDDFHAARVLPGFVADAKIKLLQEFKDQAEIILCINANDIGTNKLRADLGITYDMDALRLIDNIRGMGLYISSIVITQYTDQPAAVSFKNMLELRGEKVYLHYPIKGYPTNIDVIVSDAGYGANDYVPTTRSLVVVTAPGPNSGKMATCLSQLYHEYKRNIKAGYAKFETFPIWNLPLKHPVNLAYESATADLKDVNMIDPFHLEAYGLTTVNYNRDVEVFPVVKNILTKITGDPNIYRSPTDMGVNMAGYGIFDDEVVRTAACQEIIRRYYRAKCDYQLGRTDQETAQKTEMIMNELSLNPSDRPVVEVALNKNRQKGFPAVAIELPDGSIVTGRGSDLMDSSASGILNSIKRLAGIQDEIQLLSLVILEPIQQLKKEILGESQPVLSLEEVLIALSICAATNTMVQLAMSKLSQLKGCQMHSSHMLSSANEQLLRKLGIELTCEAQFPSDDLYYK